MSANLIGKTSWFNQSTIHHATFYTEMYPDTWGKSGIPFERFPFHTYYGDGSEIHNDVIQVINTSMCPEINSALVMLHPKIFNAAILSH